jgi:hypothetical protein
MIGTLLYTTPCPAKARPISKLAATAAILFAYRLFILSLNIRRVDESEKYLKGTVLFNF